MVQERKKKQSKLPMGGERLGRKLKEILAVMVNH